MSPRMAIIAGPPGSGKSTAFPVSGFGIDFFNADDHAAALMGPTAEFRAHSASKSTGWSRHSLPIISSAA